MTDQRPLDLEQITAWFASGEKPVTASVADQLALTAIGAATDDVRHGVANSLYVHASPSFATLWLLPRLARQRAGAATPLRAAGRVPLRRQRLWPVA